MSEQHEDNDLALEGIDHLESEKEELVSWLENISGSNDCTLKLYRLEPEKWLGKSISGHLKDLNEPLTEEKIREKWGGGKFQIRVLSRNTKGRFKFVKSAQFKIAGDPKLDEESFTAVAVPGNGHREESSLSKIALDKMERTAEAERGRADRLETMITDARKTPGIDDATFELIRNQLDQEKEEKRELRRMIDDLRNQKPDTSAYEMMINRLEKQLEDHKQESRETRRTLEDVRNLKPDTSSQDRLFEVLLTTKSQESQSMQTRFESERRQLQDSHNEDIKRVHDRYDRDIQAYREDNKRQADTLKESYEHRIKTLELNYLNTDGLLKSRIQTLEEELKAGKGELTRLREEKAKSPVEWIQELATIKESLDVLGDKEGKTEEEAKPTWERVLDRFAPVVEAVGTRFANPQAGGMSPEQQMLVMQQQQAALAAAQADVVTPEETAAKRAVAQTEKIKAEDISKFISFLEGAVSNGTDPAVFARGVSSMVPGSVLRELLSYGADGLVDAIAAQRPDSPIVSQSGRNFLRKCFQVFQGYPVEGEQGVAA